MRTPDRTVSTVLWQRSTITSAQLSEWVPWPWQGYQWQEHTRALSYHSSTHTYTPVKGRTWLKPITRTKKLCQLKSLSEPCHGHLVPEGESFLSWACLLLSQAEYHTHPQKEAHYNSTHRQNDSIKYGSIHSHGTDTDQHLYLHACVWYLVRKWTRLIQPES